MSVASGYTGRVAGEEGLENFSQGVLENLGEKGRTLPNHQGKNQTCFNQPQATGSRNFSVPNHFTLAMIT